MDVASRSSEGLPCPCPVCGKDNWIAPSSNLGDAVCAHCGSWLNGLTRAFVQDYEQILAVKHGIQIETDGQYQICRVTLTGHRFNDTMLEKLKAFRGIPAIDVSQSWITRAGARKLRTLLPGTVIVHDQDPEEEFHE